MKTSNIAIIVLIAFIVGFVLGMTVQRKFRPCVELPVVTVHDTITRVDTIREKVPEPAKAKKVRNDTLRLKISPQGNDSTRVDTMTAHVQVNAAKDSATVSLPIEQREYITPNYKAVVEGFRPVLKSMEVYQKTITVNTVTTKTLVKSPRWALTIGPGFSWDGQKVKPSVSVGGGFVIWSK